MTEVVQDESQQVDRPRPTRWDLAPGNYVHMYWVSGMGRTVETHGVIRSNGGGCVIITANALTPLDKAQTINIQRIRHVDVITEGNEAKVIRKQAWELLKQASRCINRVSTWDSDGFMLSMADLMRIFPTIREVATDEDE